MNTMSDYYSILGVNKNDDEKTIKSAYRKLARKYHPDVNSDNPDAEKKFGEINQAYEVLSDPEKKKLYDRFGPDFEKYQQAGATAQGPDFGGFGGFNNTRGGNVNFDFQGMGDFGDIGDIFNMFSGGSRGRGPRTREPQPIEHELTISLDEALHGTSRTLQLQTQQGVQSIDIKVPAGIKPGSVLKVGGKGDIGSGQKILITIQVQPQDGVEISGSNLTRTESLDMFTAVLGGTLDVKTHKGTVSLKIPAGTQGGQKFRLKGFGFSKGKGKHGDLYIKVSLVTPTNLSETQKSQFEQLAKELKGA